MKIEEEGAVARISFRKSHVSAKSRLPFPVHFPQETRVVASRNRSDLFRIKARAISRVLQFNPTLQSYNNSNQIKKNPK